MRYHTSFITMRVLELAHESVSLAGKRSRMPTRKILQSKATWHPSSKQPSMRTVQQWCNIHTRSSARSS